MDTKPEGFDKFILEYRNNPEFDPDLAVPSEIVSYLAQRALLEANIGTAGHEAQADAEEAVLRILRGTTEDKDGDHRWVDRRRWETFYWKVWADVISYR
jgi:hypothetical protein